MSYVWYVSFGSNLSRQRFLCYITGGTPRFGREIARGCADRTLPVASKPTTIKHHLYFALPVGVTGTPNWGAGGVAFVDPCPNGQANTLCRMWKITVAQYEDVRQQEGPWYDHELSLGADSDCPMVTITNHSCLENIVAPSDSYLRTIALGLRETHLLDDNEVTGYLLQKAGIRGLLQKSEVVKTIS